MILAVVVLLNRERPCPGSSRLPGSGILVDRGFLPSACFRRIRRFLRTGCSLRAGQAFRVRCFPRIRHTLNAGQALLTGQSLPIKVFLSAHWGIQAHPGHRLLKGRNILLERRFLRDIPQEIRPGPRFRFRGPHTRLSVAVLHKLHLSQGSVVSGKPDRLLPVLPM